LIESSAKFSKLDFPVEDGHPTLAIVNGDLQLKILSFFKMHAFNFKAKIDNPAKEASTPTAALKLLTFVVFNFLYFPWRLSNIKVSSEELVMNDMTFAMQRDEDFVSYVAFTVFEAGGHVDGEKTAEGKCELALLDPCHEFSKSDPIDIGFLIVPQH
jgi:hypothetical protein